MSPQDLYTIIGTNVVAGIVVVGLAGIVVVGLAGVFFWPKAARLEPRIDCDKPNAEAGRRASPTTTAIGAEARELVSRVWA